MQKRISNHLYASAGEFRYLAVLCKHQADAVAGDGRFRDREPVSLETETGWEFEELLFALTPANLIGWDRAGMDIAYACGCRVARFSNQQTYLSAKLQIGQVAELVEAQLSISIDQ